MSSIAKLPVTDLKVNFALSEFDKSVYTTPNCKTILGQSRAQTALKFGVTMQSFGYNIFVMGEPGSGRMTMVDSFLNAHAKQQQSPTGYAYVENFENKKQPLAIKLPINQGKKLCLAIEILLDKLLATFPSVFESPSYQLKKKAIEEKFKYHYNLALKKVESKGLTLNIAL